MMRARGALFAVGLLGAVLAGPARAVDAPVTSVAPAAPAATADREILVLLRLPPPHYRADGGYGGGYGDAAGHAARLRVADRLARTHGLTLVTDWPMPLLGVDCYVMAAPAGRSPAEEAASLSHDPRVAWSEPMHVYHGEGAPAPAPNDPLYRAQPAASLWRLAALHEISRGRDVMVAVVDSQVDTGHPDLAGQVRISESFVTEPPVPGESHGTGVAGVIAARDGNALGISGVAPDARLMALRACWQSGDAPATVCDTLSLAKALHFAVLHGARVINLSLAGPSDTLLGQLIDVALRRGVTVVGAYDRALPGGGFPASHPGVVAVSDGPVADGPAALYIAPGRGIPTTQPGGRWSLVNGSSFAAAHVSGLVALTRAMGGRGTDEGRLVSRLNAGGEIDACATLLRVRGPCDCACARPAAGPAVLRR